MSYTLIKTLKILPGGGISMMQYSGGMHQTQYKILRCGKEYSKKRTSPPTIGRIIEVIDDVVKINDDCLSETDRAIIHMIDDRLFITLEKHEFTIPVSYYYVVDYAGLEDDIYDGKIMKAYKVKKKALSISC